MNPSYPNMNFQQSSMPAGSAAPGVPAYPNAYGVPTTKPMSAASATNQAPTGSIAPTGSMSPDILKATGATVDTPSVHDLGKAKTQTEELVIVDAPGIIDPRYMQFLPPTEPPEKSSMVPYLIGGLVLLYLLKR